jgi:DNA-directed RNA polymerase specialized sigma24 family protein
LDFGQENGGILLKILDNSAFCGTLSRTYSERRPYNHLPELARFTMTPEALRQRLSDPELLRSLSLFVGNKLPDSEARDVAQATVMDALVARELPEEAAVKGWLFGIARHKIADHYRRRKEQVPLDHEPLPASSEQADASVGELLRWVERELPAGADARRTLDWMLREADGDPLETIAAEHQLPAPTVRQRVSRLRRHLRERWSTQLAAAVLGLLVVVTGYTWYESNRRVPLSPEVVKSPTEVERADALRRLAFQQCAVGKFDECMKTLEAAKALDPLGDQSPDVQAARRAIDTDRAAAASSERWAQPDKSKSLTPKPATSAGPVPTNTAISPQRPVPEKSLRSPTTPRRAAAKSDDEARDSAGRAQKK